MPLVRKLVRGERGWGRGPAPQKEVKCVYTIFSGVDGRKYLQIETFGSPNKRLPNKKVWSQSIQFDHQSLCELVRIIHSIISEKPSVPEEVTKGRARAR